MELPDPRCPISTSTHKPETTTNTLHLHCTHCCIQFNVTIVRNRWWASTKILLYLSPEWQNWMLSTLSWKESSNMENNQIDNPSSICSLSRNMLHKKVWLLIGALTVCSWSSDTFSGLPLPTKYILMTSSVLPVARNIPPEKKKTLKVF